MTDKLTFQKHVLEGFWVGRSPNSGGALVKPTLLVIHYTASGGATGKGDADFFLRPQAKASAHFVVGRSGDIAQVVECNRRAWHAGVSSWKGRGNCNDFSIGIEVDNWGWLSKKASGTFTSYTGAVIPADEVVESRHKNKGCPYQYWEEYPYEQIQSVIALAKAILAAYPSITDIVGHEDIAPGRKIDPGPAFPWTHFSAQVEGNEDDPIKTTRVNASKLNVRGGPGTNFDVVGTIGHGAIVFMETTQDEWSKITFTTWLGLLKEGWVYSSYL